MVKKSTVDSTQCFTPQTIRLIYHIFNNITQLQKSVISFYVATFLASTFALNSTSASTQSI
jgi:hypothetical protein